MHMNKYILLVIITALMVFTSCKSKSSSEVTKLNDSIDVYKNSEYTNPLDSIGHGYPIFYNMYLSVEISTLFKTTNVVYNPELLNSHSKISDYITSDQKALNVGVYAVDLSYARVFEQFEVAGQYLNSMQMLAQELSIPGDFFQGIVKRFEANLDNRDSIVKIANEVYEDVEQHLIENERYATAALVVLGGWSEAMYIASKIVMKHPTVDLLERYAEQKYSISNLIVLLSEHKDNEVVKKHLLKLYEINSKLQELDYPFTGDNEANMAIIEKNKDKLKKTTELLIELRSSIVE